MNESNLIKISKRISNGCGWNESLMTMVAISLLLTFACAFVTQDFATSRFMRDLITTLEPLIPAINNIAKDSWSVEVVKAQTMIGVCGAILMFSASMLFGPRLRHMPKEWTFKTFAFVVFIGLPLGVGIILMIIHGPFDRPPSSYVSRGAQLLMTLKSSRVGTAAIVAFSALMFATISNMVVLSPFKIIFTTIHMLKESNHAE